jgi:hypothetical protein
MAASAYLAVTLLGTLLPRASPAAPAARPPAAASVPCFRNVQPPIDVALEALDPLRPGAIVRFRVTATPRLSAGELRIDVRPGDGVEWVAGARAQRRDGRRDETAAFEFAVRVPRSGRHPLHVEVSLEGAEGRRWRRGVGIGLGPNPRADAARQLPDGRGGEVLEYPAGPAQPGSGARR